MLKNNNFVFDMSLKALMIKRKWWIGGNLVAEEDVMTKLPAIKTRFHFEGLLSSAEMYSESQILRFIMEQVGEIICDLMVRSFAICHKLSQL